MSFIKFSDDGFIIAIVARDPKFSREKTKEFLLSVGATEVELVEEEL